MIRHTPFASWKDPDAWMEEMKGVRWNTVLDQEAALVNKQLEKPDIQRRIGPFYAQLGAVSEAAKTIPFTCGSVSVDWQSQFIKIFLINGKEHVVRDLVCKDTMIWCSHDVGKGAETFQLECWKKGKLIWKKKPQGPDVALKNDRLYYLGVKNKLIYHELWSCDAATGNDPRLLYTEKNPEAVLGLEKQPDGRILLMSEHAQKVQYWEITEKGLKSTEHHKIPANWHQPYGDYGTEFVWPRLNLLLTKRHGSKILWKCSTTKPPKKLLEIPAGQIQIDPFSAHAGNPDCLVRVVTPDQTAFYRLNSAGNPVLEIPVQPTGLVTRCFSAISKDGTRVYGILTHLENRNPEKLLMVGYGAYGLQTAVGSIMKRWAPLVQNGWAIGYTFLRGGGDHTDAWADAGRLEGRQKTIQDFEALIRAAQQILKIPSNKTAIYGRSAGGLLMGATLANSPDGSLMSAVYTEVPYVDELRTTTNPDLPLTVLEYNEFGNPSERLEDFISVGLLSPADSAATTAAPGIFVLTRTAENDSQVYAYESVKWIRRLRSHDSAGAAPKLCIVERGQGHFTPPEKTSHQWAVDCALLDGWIQGSSR
jgi:protease II